MDISDVEYEYIEYFPMLTTPLLAFRLGNPFARITVPLLFHDSGHIMESYEIAKFASKQGNKSLFPADPEKEKTIRLCNDLSDTALRAYRAIIIEKTAHSSSAKWEALPPVLPQGIKKLLTPLANMGIHYLRWKYHTQVVPFQEQKVILRKALLEVRNKLGKQKKYVLDDFSFADIALAITISSIKPVSDDYLPLGKHTREISEEYHLAEEFQDLLEWRDEIYKNHRN